MTTMTNVAVLVPPSGGPAGLATYRAVFGGPVFDLSFAAVGLSSAGHDLLARADILAVAPSARAPATAAPRWPRRCATPPAATAGSSRWAVPS